MANAWYVTAPCLGCNCGLRRFTWWPAKRANGCWAVARLNECNGLCVAVDVSLALIASDLSPSGWMSSWETEEAAEADARSTARARGLDLGDAAICAVPTLAPKLAAELEQLLAAP